MPKKTPEKTETHTDKNQRRIKKDRHKSFRLEKPIKRKTAKVPNVWQLLKRSLAVLFENWKLFGGIVLIYGLLNLALVQGFSVGAGISETKLSLEQTFTGGWSQLASSASLFLQMISDSEAAGNQAAGAYQFILVLIVSLALIWALRQAYAKNKKRIRDAFYGGMYPLATFLLVLAVVALQLLPVLIGAFLYTQVVSSGIASTTVEMLMWGGVFLVLATFSLYLISSSLFALYIVCLPDMTPMRALRSARDLVRYRRWTVMRKVLFLPIILILGGGLIIIPILMLATPLAPWIFLVLNLAALAIVHSYMYQLYRSLL